MGGGSISRARKTSGIRRTTGRRCRIWDRQAVLADIVRVIRAFRPDVIVTRFSPQPGHTHGHHTASVVLAVEAFKLAGDPAGISRAARRADAVATQAHSSQRRRPGGAGAGVAGGGGLGVLKLDVGGNDPVSGESFASIAARSRAMHKTQGFGVGGSAVARRRTAGSRRFGRSGASPPPGTPRRSGHDVEPRAGWRRDRTVDRATRSRNSTWTIPRPACPRCWRFAAGWPRCPRTPS